MKRSEAVILALSLAAGLLGTCLFSGYASEPAKPIRLEQTAWWGGLYPEYGVAGLWGPKNETARGFEGAPEREIRFRYLTFLNELGGQMSELRDAPIGVFDSGIGGLTVARGIMHDSQERIVYFGDTARLPYGSKSRNTIIDIPARLSAFCARGR